MRHPNILHFFGVCYERSTPAGPRLPKWIVTEKQPYSLHAFRLPGVRDSLGLDGVVLLSLDIADGLAKNVLVGPGGGAKLADLGTAKMVGIAARTTVHTVGPGTAIYHPPEVLDGRYTAAIDVFSLGLTIIEVVLGGDPSQKSPISIACTNMRREHGAEFLRLTGVSMFRPAESPNRQGAHAAVDADQQRRALSAHPLLGPVVEGCLAQQPRQRITSPAVIELLTAVAVEPGFGASAAVAGRAGGVRWAESARQQGLRALIGGVTRRRREMLRQQNHAQVVQQAREQVVAAEAAAATSLAAIEGLEEERQLRQALETTNAEAAAAATADATGLRAQVADLQR